MALYFYPLDNTSSCTQEAVDFTAALPELQKMKAEMVGISKYSPASHRKFRELHGLAVLPLSDIDHRAMHNYGVWAKKKMYGKESYGIGPIHLLDRSSRERRFYPAIGQGQRACGCGCRDEEAEQLTGEAV